MIFLIFFLCFRLPIFPPEIRISREFYKEYNTSCSKKKKTKKYRVIPHDEKTRETIDESLLLLATGIICFPGVNAQIGVLQYIFHYYNIFFFRFFFLILFYVLRHFKGRVAFDCGLHAIRFVVRLLRRAVVLRCVRQSSELRQMKKKKIIIIIKKYNTRIVRS